MPWPLEQQAGWKRAADGSVEQTHQVRLVTGVEAALTAIIMEYGNNILNHIITLTSLIQSCCWYPTLCTLHSIAPTSRDSVGWAVQRNGTVQYTQHYTRAGRHKMQQYNINTTMLHGDAIALAPCTCIAWWRWSCPVLYSAVQCIAILYCTILYCTVMYGKERYCTDCADRFFFRLFVVCFCAARLSASMVFCMAPLNVLNMSAARSG